MSTRELAHNYRLSNWARIARERAESGQNIRDFCRNRGIHENTYYYWQRRLRETSAEVLTAVEPQQLPAPSGWTEVAEVEIPAPKTLTVEVGAFRVAVDSSTDTELLSRTLKVLAELC